MVLALWDEDHLTQLHLSIRDVETGAEQTVVTTGNHPFFVQTTRQVANEATGYAGPLADGHWLYAATLQAGDRLLNADGTWAEVLAAETVNEPLLAYNLTVEGFHTYFVAANEDAAPVWVHNSCGAQQLLNQGAVRISNTEIIGIDGRIYTKGTNGSYVKGHVATTDQINSSGVDIDYSYFSTAKGNQYTFPTNLTEEYLFEDVLANPSLGRALNLSRDTRFPTAEGWQKMHRSLTGVDGTITVIHYQWNQLTGSVVDLKFTP